MRFRAIVVILSSCLSVAVPGPAAGQHGILKGQVVDRFQKKASRIVPLDFVDVVVTLADNTELQADDGGFTDSKGNYTFSKVPAGKVTVTFHKPEHLERNLELNAMIVSGQETTLNADLYPERPQVEYFRGLADTFIDGKVSPANKDRLYKEKWLKLYAADFPARFKPAFARALVERDERIKAAIPPLASYSQVDPALVDRAYILLEEAYTSNEPNRLRMASELGDIPISVFADVVSEVTSKHKNAEYSNEFIKSLQDEFGASRVNASKDALNFRTIDLKKKNLMKREDLENAVKEMDAKILRVQE